MVYEVVTFQALREQLRCKEIWVVGADSWRNSDEDLPADFPRRAENYRELRKPLDPSVFIGDLRSEVVSALAELHTVLPSLDWLAITDRASGAITLTKHEAAPGPRNLRRIKAEVQRRWGTVALIDILKEAVLRTDCLNEVSAVAGSGTLPVKVLAERLMLAIYAYSTNTGMRAVAAGGGHGHTEARSATSAAATSPATPLRRSRSVSRTRRSRPDNRACEVKARPRSRRTRPTFAPTIRTSSPSGTPGTEAAGS